MSISSNQFAGNMFIQPTDKELAEFQVEWTVINAPGFKADPKRQHETRKFAILDFSDRCIIIGRCGLY